jgi:hypothetical protein
MGKVMGGWDALRDDALERDSFVERRQRFLDTLSGAAKAGLEVLSQTQRDDAKGERPNTERSDAEEALFGASLPAKDQAFLIGHKGLGNSQKAEVAWLERRYQETGNVCYLPDEVDVRDVMLSAADRDRTTVGGMWNGMSTDTSSSGSSGSRGVLAALRRKLGST